MRRLLRRPSPAMGVALLALFVALGGVSYGVATSSIGTRAIKDVASRAATSATRPCGAAT